MEAAFRLGASGLKTLTSKNARCLVHQNPFAATSSLAPSFLLANLRVRTSLAVQAQQGIDITLSRELCFGQTVTLTCTHPDPFQDLAKYLPVSISFTENGEALDITDPDTARRFTLTRLSSTASTLSFTVTEEDHANRVVTCSCFLALTGGGREESDPITIDVEAIVQPPTILSKPDGTSGLLQWRPSSNCSDYQFIFNLTWVRIGDGSTGTVSTAENRYDFTGMPGGEYTAALKARVTNFNLSESVPAHDCWITIIQPPTILSTPDSTSGLLQWRPSSSCSNYQYIFNLTWVRIGDGSTGTVSTAENWYDFTGMTGGNYTASITAAIVGVDLDESEPLIVTLFRVTTPIVTDVIIPSQDSFIFITALAAVSAVAGVFLITSMVLSVILVILVGVLVRMRRRRREDGQERKRRADPGEDNIPPVAMTTNPSYAQVQRSTEKKIPLYGNL